MYSTLISTLTFSALCLCASVVSSADDSIYKPPAELAGDLGSYRSPLKFDDGTPVKNADDWKKRRVEIMKYWHGAMGEWPALIEKPKVEILKTEMRGTVTQHHIKIETAPGHITD